MLGLDSDAVWVTYIPHEIDTQIDERRIIDSGNETGAAKMNRNHPVLPAEERHERRWIVIKVSIVLDKVRVPPANQLLDDEQFI